MYIYHFLSLMPYVFLIHSIFPNQFEQALENHQKNDLKQAYSLYCTIPKKTSNIIFNMALIAYHEQLYPKAIALWRIASLYTTIFTSYKIINATSSAIAHVKSEQKVPIEWSGHPMDSKKFLFHFIFVLCWYLQAIPLWIIQCLFILISIYIAIIVLMILKNSHPIKKKLLYLTIASIVLSFAGYNIKLRTASYGITEQVIKLRQGPEDFFESLAELSPLTELIIKVKKGSWYKVQYQNIIGWIPEQALYIIDNNEMCSIPIINRSQHY